MSLGVSLWPCVCVPGGVGVEVSDGLAMLGLFVLLWLAGCCATLGWVAVNADQQTFTMNVEP